MNERVLSDHDLVVAARGGDRDAFGELVGRHRPMLLALCTRSIGDPTSAEEVTQDAALHAMLDLARLRRPERFGPWLAGIGLNLCRRRLRYRTRDAWSLDVLAGGRTGAELPASDPDPAELAEAADLAERVRRAVATLPPGQRAAVRLFYLAGLSHADTAATLGVASGAVKSRLHHARAALRARLQPFWEEYTMTIEQPVSPWVPVRIADVRRRPPADDKPRTCVAILEEVEPAAGTAAGTLPIWMGPFEGESLAMQLKGVEIIRPLTYTFMASLLQTGGVVVREVRITRLESDTFYAVALVQGPDGVREVDARPSDALNLALAVGASVSVERGILDRVTRQWQERRAQQPEVEAGLAALSEGADAIVAEMRERWQGARQSALQPPAAQPDQQP